MVNQNPEQIARDEIDKRLRDAGWSVQNKKEVDWSKSIGVAVREYPTENGKPVDYALFVDKEPVGVIEAKRDEEGHKITRVEEQSSGYADSPLKGLSNEPLPFRYEATGVLTRFTDIRDPKPRSREVFSFYRPETLKEKLEEEKTLRGRLTHELSIFESETGFFRDCQIKAIKNLEVSLKENRPRALIQMATGSGKTFTAITYIIKTFKQKLPEIFPNRKEVPKTLIFAKTDSHADDIIQMVRGEFNEDNSFCKKITYQADEDPKSLLSDFRNNYNPRIAVTVDMIATGTDVKPLECLIFMRDVRSKNYYEQMLGRGTRTLGKDDLKKVSPSSATQKTHFVVVDAVGVSKSIKTEMVSLERNKTVPTKDLLNAVLMGNKEEDVYSSLGSRLSRIAKKLTSEEEENYKNLSKGKTPKDHINALLHAHDPDFIEDMARKQFNIPKEREPTKVQKKEVQKILCKETQSMFNGDLNQFIVTTHQAQEQIIDRTNPDEVKQAGWLKEKRATYKTLTQEFEEFLEEHKDEITALKIFYNEPHRRKEVTYAMIEEIYNKLKEKKPTITPIEVFEAYAELESKILSNPLSELTDLPPNSRHRKV